MRSWDRGRCRAGVMVARGVASIACLGLTSAGTAAANDGLSLFPSAENERITFVAQAPNAHRSTAPILLAQLDLSQNRAAGVSAGPPPPAGIDALVETLSGLPLPSYVSPDQDASLGWSRSLGAVRSGQIGARVEALAPGDHTGLSLSESPRLWWRLDSETRHPLQISIVDDDSIDPLLVVEFGGPHTAGLASLDLSQHGVRLKPDVEYRWFVSILVDRERPSRNPLSEGSIRVLSASDDRRDEVAQAPSPMRGHRLAELGVWYDAYDFFSALAVEHPEISAIGRHRDQLTQTVLVED